MARIRTPWDRVAEVDPSDAGSYSGQKMAHPAETYIEPVAPALPEPRPEPRITWTTKITPDRVTVEDIRLAESLMGDTTMRAAGLAAPSPVPAAPPANERELPIFLVPADVAALLRTSVKAVYAKVERGLLPGVIKDGTRVLFDRDVLLRELRAGKGRLR